MPSATPPPPDRGANDPSGAPRAAAERTVLLETVTRHATLALFILDERQHCTYMNPAAEALTGYTLAELRDRPLHDSIHHSRPDGSPYPRSECPIHRALPQGEREHGEEVFVHRDGRFYPVAFTASPLREDGRPVGTVLEVRDVSEERLPAAELRRQQERYRFLAETIPAQVWTARPDGLLDYVSERTARYFGVPAARLLGDGWIDMLHPADVAPTREGWQRSLGSGEPYEARFRLRRADGEYRWHLCRANAMRDADGASVTWFGVNADVHDQVVAERERERLMRELEVERARLATVFREAPALIATLRGPEHVLEMANPPFRRFVGDREIVGRPIREAFPELERQGFFELLDRVYETGEPVAGTERSIRLQPEADGEAEERFVTFVYQPLVGAEGATEGILVHGVEVTEVVRTRRRAEDQAVELEAANLDLRAANAALDEERARLAAVVEHAPVGLVIAEAPSGRILMGNRRVEEIFRHRVLRSGSVREYREWIAFHPDGRQVEGHEFPLARALASGERVGPEEYLARRGDGTTAWVQITGAPIHDAEGRLTGALVVVDDIDAERRAVEEREHLLARIDEERRLLQEVFEHAPAVMALYSGPDHVVELVNPTWERTVGKADALGKPFREVFPEFADTGLFDTLRRIYRTGEPYLDPEVTVPLDRWGDGAVEETVWNLAWLPLPVRDDGTRDILVHAVEMTEQVRSREQVRALTRAALAVHSAPTLDEALRVITEEARTLIGAHQAVTSMTTTRDWAQAINAVSLSEKYAAWRAYTPPPDGSGIYAMICETNRAVRFTQAQLERHPRWRGFGGHAPEHPPMRGWLAAPLIGRDGENLGLIQLSDRYTGDFSDQDEAVLVQLAQMASVAIENARLYEEAVEANRVKTGFLATMSHELRTPLNAMIGYAQLLEMGVPETIPGPAVRQVERIRLSAQHLLQLIEEILTFSRVEAGRERVEMEAVSLHELAAEVGAIIEPLALQKQLDFRLDAGEADVTLHTDPRKVRQILLNLLGNAIKFTERGGVRFRARREDEQVLMEVADTGIGIAPEHLDRIFEPFWQAETEIHARVSGTGLGLPVTRQLTELLGGTVEVESTPGAGTTVRLRLPLEPAAGDGAGADDRGGRAAP